MDSLDSVWVSRRVLKVTVMVLLFVGKSTVASLVFWSTTAPLTVKSEEMSAVPPIKKRMVREEEMGSLRVNSNDKALPSVTVLGPVTPTLTSETEAGGGGGGGVVESSLRMETVAEEVPIVYPDPEEIWRRMVSEPSTMLSLMMEAVTVTWLVPAAKVSENEPWPREEIEELERE